MNGKSKLSATNTLILINVVLFIPFLLLNNLVSNSWESTFRHLQVWRLITAIFAHGNFSHLFNNMISLFFIGNSVELREDNRPTFIGKYMICGIVANIVSVILNHNIATVGASGAICGLLGLNLKQAGATRKPIIICIIFLIISGVTSPNVDWVAHVIGFITGVILAV